MLEGRDSRYHYQPSLLSITPHFFSLNVIRHLQRLFAANHYHMRLEVTFTSTSSGLTVPTLTFHWHLEEAKSLSLDSRWYIVCMSSWIHILWSLKLFLKFFHILWPSAMSPRTSESITRICQILIKLVVDMWTHHNSVTTLKVERSWAVGLFPHPFKMLMYHCLNTMPSFLKFSGSHLANGSWTPWSPNVADFQPQFQCFNRNPMDLGAHAPLRTPYGLLTAPSPTSYQRWRWVPRAVLSKRDLASCVKWRHY